MNRDGAPFPTLDGDLGEALPGRSGTAKRVCIATADVLGPIRNGGIGTACHHMARMLAGRGHRVVVAYVNDNAADSRLMEEARALHAGFGVDFEPIVPRPASSTMLARVSAPTWTLHDWLRLDERGFDVVHVPDWRGLGYGPLLAKSLGAAFAETHFVVMGHAPTLWAVEGGKDFVSTERELGWVFMERRSVELADTFISVSAHLVEWMREAGYDLPARTFVWPNVFPAPDPSPDAAAERAARDGVRLEEVVFFGRLEPRKGLVLFVDALDRLARRGRAPERITFLGGRSERIDGQGLIRSSARDWPAEVRTFTDFGSAEAVAYLSRPGRLAVIPSLVENSSMAVMECLQAGIPFLAAATGGTPELVASEDRARALVPPDHVALGERIAELAGAPLRAVRPRWDFARSLEVWSRWHGQTGPFEAARARFAERARAAGAEQPRVTVCIVHHERPALVRMAVESVYAQDYPALDAVLVDDGSERAEARAALDEIEAEFGVRGWRVVRQENRYLGAARNAAAAAARGEWLVFLDDDNVLFPDAVSRLVRAARFSGADCVPAASVRFFGGGDPRTDPGSHGAPIRFLGAARAWSRFANVIGDACALVRRGAFEAAGGFTEEYRVGLDDLSFYNRLIRAGRRIEPLPDPVYWYRFGETSMKSRNRSLRTARVRVLAPYLAGLPDEERAYSAYAADRIARSADAAEPQPHRDGWVLALACRSPRLGIGRLEAGVLPDPEWAGQGEWSGGRGRSIELRRNGRVLARAPVQDFGGFVRLAARRPLPRPAAALYSVHDAETGAVLAAVAAPSFLRAHRVVGAVESRPRPEVRGWVLDRGNPRRRRRVAIHVDGRLREVVAAEKQRDDVARWQGTDGRHGFLWRVPEQVAAMDGIGVEVFDADSGRPLRGSPVRVAGGRVVASRRRLRSVAGVLTSLVRSRAAG